MNRLQYQIHEETMYIVSVNNNGSIESRVGETYGDSLGCRLNPNKVIERNCRNHSQNYIARKDLTKSLTNITSKIPVIVDLFGAYIYFCTNSDRVQENNWFNIKHVQAYWDNNGMTRIQFSNRQPRTYPATRTHTHAHTSTRTHPHAAATRTHPHPHAQGQRPD